MSNKNRSYLQYPVKDDGRRTKALLKKRDERRLNYREQYPQPVNRVAEYNHV